MHLIITLDTLNDDEQVKFSETIDRLCQLIGIPEEDISATDAPESLGWPIDEEAVANHVKRVYAEGVGEAEVGTQ
jgi:hypothetical protein